MLIAELRTSDLETSFDLHVSSWCRRPRLPSLWSGGRMVECRSIPILPPVWRWLEPTAGPSPPAIRLFDSRSSGRPSPIAALWHLTSPMDDS